jgi:hypothetical protein
VTAEKASEVRDHLAPMDHREPHAVIEPVDEAAGAGLHGDPGGGHFGVADAAATEVTDQVVHPAAVGGIEGLRSALTDWATTTWSRPSNEPAGQVSRLRMDDAERVLASGLLEERLQIGEEL